MFRNENNAYRRPVCGNTRAIRRSSLRPACNKSEACVEHVSPTFRQHKTFVSIVSLRGLGKWTVKQIVTESSSSVLALLALRGHLARRLTHYLPISSFRVSLVFPEECETNETKTVFP